MTVCKRIGAWLLTLVLLVSALPYTAFAASEDSHDRTVSPFNCPM